MYSKMYFIFIFIFLSVICFSVFPQEIKKGEVYLYARKVVDTLASESMHGRGYVNAGDSIAANYIKTEFKKAGLRFFTDDYYQKLYFPINTFQNESPSFSINHLNEHWKAGKNFLVSADCPTIAKQKVHEAVWFDSATVSSLELMKKFTKKKFDKKWIIIDSHGITDKDKLKLFDFMKTNPYNAFGVAIVNDKKLTWTCSQKVSKFPSVELLINDSLRSRIIKSQKLTIAFESKNKFIPKHISQNVIGYIQGAVYPDSFIIFSAHYDHLGQMGKDVYFPGANDNASGCAMLLNLAKHFAMPEYKPKCSIVFIAFCGEEVGLLGSKYFTDHPLFPLKNIKFVFNMDIMGTGEEGITVVNGTVFKKEFDMLKEINSQNNFIKDIKIRGKAANSDHYTFSEKGVKSFFIYTMGGIKAYHDIYDRPETLPLNEFGNLFNLITKFGDYLQN
jgi:aminopeptidase YwaD